MNTKCGLYAVIGGIVGAVLTMAVCSVMPLGAQNGDATFGDITCTGLKVVDEKGTTRATVYAGGVTVRDKSEVSASMSANESGAGVTVRMGNTPDKSSWVRILALETDAYVSVNYGNDSAARVSATEHSGRVSVFGKGRDMPRAALGVDKYGKGGVFTWD